MIYFIDVFFFIIYLTKLMIYFKVKFQRWDEKRRNFVESVQLVHNPTGLCLQTKHGVKDKGNNGQGSKEIRQ